MRSHRLRTGFTLLELMVVLALLIILAAVTLPSLSGLKGNSEQKAAADQLRSRIADARSLAMDQATPYRLALNAEGTKIRVAPDTVDFAQVGVSDEAVGGATAIETTLSKATVRLMESEQVADAAGDDEWITVATFLPNGTCREASAVLEVHETGFPPMRFLLRGVTASATLLPNDPSNGGSQ